jgi:transglutaminase/protease-like cytokinesis protein 3
MKCFPFYIVNIGSAALRSVVLYFFIATAATVCAQDFDRTDATIQLYPETFDEVAQFDRFLSRDFNTDEEKVRAIYSWLINNISYDPDAYKLFNYNFKDYRERNQKEERSRKKIIEHTLRTGKAVCEGYAMTFEKLLTLQGIDNYLIQGDTKTHFKDIDRKFDLSHMWNAIKIDDSWYLFDTTWGAGKYTSKFVKEPSYYYYQIAPS